MNFIEEIARRRTFGIISHPDAGKTTLTEKLIVIWWCYTRSWSSQISQNKKRSY